MYASRRDAHKSLNASAFYTMQWCHSFTDSYCSRVTNLKSESSLKSFSLKSICVRFKCDLIASPKLDSTLSLSPIWPMNLVLQLPQNIQRVASYTAPADSSSSLFVTSAHTNIPLYLDFAVDLARHGLVGQLDLGCISTRIEVSDLWLLCGRSMVIFFNQLV